MDKQLPAREKCWNELYLTEKVERLRLVIKQQEHAIEKITNCLDKLVNHHHLGGKIVSEISHSNADLIPSMRLIKQIWRSENYRNDDWL